MKNYIIIALSNFIFLSLSYGQNNLYNYKQTINVQTPVKTETALNSVAPDFLMEEVIYYDGLGRPIQNVFKRFTADRKDVITFKAYNELGLENRMYLPFPQNDGSGNFRNNVISEQASYYQNSVSATAKTLKPFAENIFDNSPLKEILEQGSFGEEWQPGTNHTVRVNRRANTDADNVMIWRDDAPDNIPYAVTDYSSTTLCLANFNSTQNCGITHGTNVIDIGNNSSPTSQDSKVYELKNISGFNTITISLQINPAKQNKVSFWAKNQSGGGYIYVKDNDNNVTIQTPNVNSNGLWKLVEFNINATNTSTNTINISILIGGPSSAIFLIDEVKVFEKALTSSQLPIYYKAGELKVNEITDENGNVTIEFINKNNQKVLSKVQKSTSVWLETYIVYNRLQSVSCIIPPKAIAKMKQTNNFSIAQLGEDLLFYYKYDEKKRVVEKKEPGGAVTYIVYDPLDRVVLLQHNNLRTQLKWIFTKYDELSRIIYTGLYTADASATRTSLQNSVNSGSIFSEKDAVNNLGYTTNVFPIQNLEILQRNYFGDYDINNDGTADYTYQSFSGFDATLVSSMINLVPTISIAKILNSTTEVVKVSFVNQKEQVIQVVETNPEGGSNTTNFAYNFVGKVTKNALVHKKTASSVAINVNRRTDFDHMGRAKHNWYKIDQKPEIILSSIAYNNLGQVSKKGIHGLGLNDAYLQQIDYSYTTRGWLKSINRPDITNADDDIFGMEFYYETTGGFDGQAQYNGNMSAYKWQSRRDGIIRGYGFHFDNAGQVTNANFKAYDRGSEVELGRYNVKNISYDNNGNILSMEQNGWQNNDPNNKLYGTIDNLSYSYSGNRLQNVVDGYVTNTTHNDFYDGNQGTASQPDYEYDENGNTIKDKNKGISLIEYNHLNLPKKVTFSNGNTIEYIYDASGKKWEMKSIESSVTTIYTYYNSVIYKNGVVTGIFHEEGRIVPDPVVTYRFYYDYVDHQGNVRLTYTPELDTKGEWLCTWETESGTVAQSADFQHVNETRNNTNPHTGYYSGAVENTKGAYKIINVKEGDSVYAETWAYSLPVPAEQNTPSANWLPLMGINSQNFTPPTSGEGSNSAPYIRFNFLNIVYNFINWLTPPQQIVGGALILKHTDTAGNIIAVRATEVQQAGRWEHLTDMYLPMSPGTLEISTISLPGKTYFDDFYIRHKRLKPIIVQENHYYTFGLNIKGLEYINTVYANKGLYNGNEIQSENKLEWNDYGARHFDPQLGRWHSVDPYSQLYFYTSPYGYATNNPVYFVDKEGKYTGIDDGIAFLIGGTINLIVGYSNGRIKTFADGFNYFGSGGIAGTMSLYPEFGGWIAAGMVVELNDELTRQRQEQGRIYSAQMVVDRALWGGAVSQVGGVATTQFFQFFGNRLVPYFAQAFRKLKPAPPDVGPLEYEIITNSVVPLADDAAMGGAGVYDLGTILGKYVGQSKDIMARVTSHFAKGGKLSADELNNAVFHSMPGSTKLQREVYEQFLINKYGINNLLNIRNPMGGRMDLYNSMVDDVIKQFGLPK